MNRYLSNAALALVGVVAVTIVASAPAAAKTCHFVKVTIQNSSKYPVKLFKVYFADQFNIVRAENVKNKQLLPGQSHTETSAFREIGGKPFSLQASYKSLVPNSKGTAIWGGMKRTNMQDKGTCNSRGNYTVAITN